MQAFRPEYAEGDVEGIYSFNYISTVSDHVLIDKGKTRIHLNVERWRVPEAWFQPSMAGVDSAGLGEVIQTVLARFTDTEKGRLVKVCIHSLSFSLLIYLLIFKWQNVFVTGGPSQIPNLLPRLNATLRPILPPEMPLDIVRAADPVLDAWRGMADFARTDELKRVGVTKAEYEEWGGERIKRWWGGNWNASVPI